MATDSCKATTNVIILSIQSPPKLVQWRPITAKP